MIRGDTQSFKFQRKTTSGDVITTLPDELFFTMKENFNTKNMVIQKRLDNNTIVYNEDDNYYRFTIEPEDTDGLYYGNYKYDIEVIVGSIKRTIAIGSIDITEEVTFANNEVV